MMDFVYHNPTRIIFGRGAIPQLSQLVPPEGTVLMTCGGGSIRRNGVYDQVMKALAGRKVLEFGGIPPNPEYDHLMAAVELVKRQSVTFLLSVGGGSVLDGTKFIAAAARFEGPDPWDILAAQAPVTAAVPLGAVLTLPATGSESNGGSVVSRKSIGEKLYFISNHVYPRFSILDPTTMLSLPAKQVRNGIVDAWAHVVEQYATYPAGAPLQDRQAEAILLTLLEEGPKTLKNLTDYDARANLVWCATQALNGLIGLGVPQDWATHEIGHELTALYGLDHAETLAIVMPAVLRHQKARKQAKLLQFARRVWGITDEDEDTAIERGIARMVEFFESLGMPTRLAAYQLSAVEAARQVEERLARRSLTFGEHHDITPSRAGEILRAC
jgi:NADP-dependent alcohol dehydrogenase